MSVQTAPRLSVFHSDRKALKRMAYSTSLPHRAVMPVKALVLAADGVANEVIARECSTTSDTVRRWRRKYEEGGADAVAPGQGRKRNVAQDTIDAIVHDTLHTIPDDEST